MKGRTTTSSRWRCRGSWPASRPVSLSPKENKTCTPGAHNEDIAKERSTFGAAGDLGTEHWDTGCQSAGAATCDHTRDKDEIGGRGPGLKSCSYAGEDGPMKIPLIRPRRSASHPLGL
jgi:hypothetical protein